MKGTIKNDMDWFLASICVRNEPTECSSKNAAARCVTWVNNYLIHAKDLSEAFDKAMKVGRSERDRYKGKMGMRKWRFIGLWDLQLIWGDLADGEEIFWTDCGKITDRVARRQCVTKQELLRGQNSRKKSRNLGPAVYPKRMNRKSSAPGSRR
jgi:hypothetical protein